MIKKLLYKWLFQKEKIELEQKLTLEKTLKEEYQNAYTQIKGEVRADQKKLLEKLENTNSININTILQSLNKSISFNKIDDDGKPPHYLAGMGAESRANAISKLSFIYEDNMFQEVFRYMIDLMGNKAFFVATEENMKNYRYAVLGIQAVYKEFEDAHNEFINSTKKTESFDPLEILPED